MSKPFAANTGFLPDGGTCVVTGKIIWFSRSDAKKALRKFKGRGVALQGAHAYACPHLEHGQQHWHLGHPPKKLRRGQITRGDVHANSREARQAK